MVGGTLLALIGFGGLVAVGLGRSIDIVFIVLLMGLIGIGATLIFGIKRHAILFHGDNRTLSWISSAGEFKPRRPQLRHLRDFFYQKGIIVENFPADL